MITLKVGDTTELTSQLRAVLCTYVYIRSSFMNAAFYQNTNTTEYDTSERVKRTMCEVKLIYCDTNYPVLQEIRTISNK